MIQRFNYKMTLAMEMFKQCNSFILMEGKVKVNTILLDGSDYCGIRHSQNDSRSFLGAAFHVHFPVVFVCQILTQY